jgi:hypothetical protein
MQRGGEVCDFRRREGVNPVFFDKWKKQHLGSASRVFEERGSKLSAQEQGHEAELQRLKNVIAEITAENLELRKGPRVRGPWPASPRAAEARAPGVGVVKPSHGLAREANAGCS